MDQGERRLGVVRVVGVFKWQCKLPLSLAVRPEPKKESVWSEESHSSSSEAQAGRSRKTAADQTWHKQHKQLNKPSVVFLQGRPGDTADTCAYFTSGFLAAIAAA